MAETASSVSPRPPLMKPRRLRLRRVVIVATVFMVVIIAVLTWWSFSVTVPAGCNGGERSYFSIHYSGSATGWLSFFGVPAQCAEYLAHVSPGSSYAGDHGLSLHNMDRNSSHSLELISVNAPFTLVATSPALPLVIPAGGYVNVSLRIDVPSSPGTYGSPTGSITGD